MKNENPLSYSFVVVSFGYRRRRIRASKRDVERKKEKVGEREKTEEDVVRIFLYHVTFIL